MKKKTYVNKSYQFKSSKKNKVNKLTYLGSLSILVVSVCILAGSMFSLKSLEKKKVNLKENIEKLTVESDSLRKSIQEIDQQNQETADILSLYQKVVK